MVDQSGQIGVSQGSMGSQPAPLHFSKHGGTYNLGIAVTEVMVRMAFGPMQGLLSSLADWSNEISKISTGSDYLSKLLSWIQQNYVPETKTGGNSLPWSQGGDDQLKQFTEFFRKYFIAGADSSMPALNNITIKIGDTTISAKGTPKLFAVLTNYLKQTAAAFNKTGYASKIFAQNGKQSISGFEAMILHVLVAKIDASKVQLDPNSSVPMDQQLAKILNGVLPPGSSGGDATIESAWSIFQSIPTATEVTIEGDPTQLTHSVLSLLMSNPQEGPDIDAGTLNYLHNDLTILARLNQVTQQDSGGSSGSTPPPPSSPDLLGGWVQQNQGTQQSSQGVQTATSQAETITSSELNVDFNTGQKIISTDNDQESAITQNEKSS